MEPGKLSQEEKALIFGTFLFRRVEKSECGVYIRDKSCTLETFPKGRAIYTPTEFRRSLGILLSGRADVSKKGFAVSVLEPGELFGAAALFTDQPEYESTITARSTCRVLFLPQGLVASLLSRHPEAVAGYIGYLSQRIRFLSRRLDALTAPGAGEKLGHYLLEHGGVDCSAVELAKRLDVSRASLYRALGQLEAMGAIEKRGRVISVLSREKLLNVEGTV